MSLYSDNGWYAPAFFYLGIDSDEKITESITNNISIFIHEYLHFLQDITLPYLLRQSKIFYRSFSLVILDTTTRGSLNIPFNHWDDDTKLTNLQREYTLGEGGKLISNNIGKITSIRNDYNNNNCYGQKIYRYYIDIDDSNEYQIGAVDFYEYITSKIECKFYQKSYPAIPYNTLDYVFDYYELSEIPIESRLYIVEYCLYNDNPIRFFHKIIEQIIKKNKEIFKDYKKCKKTLESYGWHSNGHIKDCEDIFSKTDRRINELLQDLNGIYNSLKLPSLNKWINSVLSYAQEVLASRFIFSELYLLDDRLKLEGIISEFISKIGIPLIFNKSNDLASWLPKDKNYNYKEFLNLYIIDNFMQFVQNDTLICPLTSLCKRINHVDEDCLDINIKMNNISTCYFTDFLKMFNLNNIKNELY
jgi:hypothetical protein